MELSCGTKCMKYLLIIINFLFFLLGAGCLGVGIWAYVDKNKLNTLTKIHVDTGDFDAAGLLETGALVLCVGGAVVLLLAFLGCCGAWKEVKCLLCLYGMFLILIICVELAAVILAAVFKSKFEDEAQKVLKKNINKYYEGKLNTSEPFSLALDFAQVTFHCCGIDSWQDFNGTEKWKKGNETIPPSCCKLDDEDVFFDDPSKAKLKEPMCPTNPSNDNSWWEKGCWQSLYDFLAERATIVIGIAAGILALEVLCLLFACCMWSALRKGDGYNA